MRIHPNGLSQISIPEQLLVEIEDNLGKISWVW